MAMNTRAGFGSVGVGALALLLAGCASSTQRVQTAQQTPAVEQAPASPAEQAKLDADAAEKEQKELEAWQEKETEHARQLDKAQRQLAIAHHKLMRAQLARQQAEESSQERLDRAEAELAFAQARHSTFVERSVPSRIAWAKLGLQGAEDRVLEAEEEMKQLELMYAQDDFADQTKEIVLDRSRRRLERSHTDLELRRGDFQTLTERTIPFETRDHEHKVELAQRGLDAARRDALGTLLDKDIALLSAEATVAQQEADLEAMREKWEKEVREREEKLRKQREAKGGGAAVDSASNEEG